MAISQPVAIKVSMKSLCNRVLWMNTGRKEGKTIIDEMNESMVKVDIGTVVNCNIDINEDIEMV